MMKRALLIVTSCALLVGVFMGTRAGAETPKPDYADAPCKSSRVLLYPAWYNGMTCKFEKDPKSGKVLDNRIPSPMIKELNDIWVIVLNVIQWIIITAGYVALFFIIVSGFKYMIARGEPAKIVEAKSTLIHAITGLIIVLLSTAIVITVQAAIKGGLR